MGLLHRRPNSKHQRALRDVSARPRPPWDLCNAATTTNARSTTYTCANCDTRPNASARSGEPRDSDAVVDYPHATVSTEVSERLRNDAPVPLALAQKLAATYARRYNNRRGAMVVDVVASAARNYDRVEQTIVPGFERLAHNKPTLESLAKSDSAQLKTLGLRANEPNTMIEVAKGLMRFGSERNITGDDAICLAWAEYAEEWRRTPKLDPYVGVKGIGIALYAYLRMRSGADAIKPDVWVARLLMEYGATIRDPKDALEVMQCAEQVAVAAGISRLTLDQMLWRGEWKITSAALKQLATTEAWRTHGLVGFTPESIYGKDGAIPDLFNVPFTTRHDLWFELTENYRMGVPIEVMEALVECCGPRVESGTSK